MLHAKDRQSRMFQCGAFTFVVFLSLIHSCRGQSKVIGPSQPIVAIIGEDVVLPCYLEPAMNAFEMTLEWVRPDPDPRSVLVWRDGVELESKKHPSYKGRASLFTDELKHGNISLKLSKVKIYDEGQYKCFMPALFSTSTVQLVVGAVSSPVVQMTKNSSGVLECESKGWYPEPEVFWLNSEGHLLSAGPTETVRGPDDLYTVHSTVTVEKRHGNNFTCRVQQKDISETRETHIHVPDHFVMVPSTPSTPHTSSSRQAIIGSTIGCAALVALLTIIFIVWKWRQNKFKNTRRSHEDGCEQTQEEKMVTSKSDNTRLHGVVEGGRESEPLMATREEESNADDTGEQKIKSQREQKDPQFVAESKTNQDQLMTKREQTRNMDNAEGESVTQPRIDEKVPQIPTEGETSGRQVSNSRDKGEEEQTMKPVKEDSGFSLVLDADENNQQPLNPHKGQEEQKEEETKQDPENDVDKTLQKKRAKEENEQGRGKERGSGLMRQKKKQENQTEPMQPEPERQRVKSKRPLQSEMQKSKESEGGEVEVRAQTGNGSQHLLEDKTEDGSRAEHEGKKDGERNQSGTRERTAENQKEQINETLKKAAGQRVENKHQSEKQEKIQIGDSTQHLSETEKQEGRMVKLEDKKGKDGEEKQSDTTRRTERPAERQKRQITEPEEKRDEKLPSVSTEVTERPETAESKDQELQIEKQKGKNSQRNQEEAKEQPERSTKQVTEECDKSQEEGLETHRGAHTETQQKSEEIDKQLRGGEGGQQQTVQQLDVKEELREQPEEPFSIHTVRGAEREDLHEEAMEVDRKPHSDETQSHVKRRGKRQREREEKLHEDQQQPVRKRRHRDEEEPEGMIPKMPREEQNEPEEAMATDQPQVQDMISQQDQQVELMES